jgi:hypothetical protein
VSLELPRETTADMVVVVVKFVLSPIFSLIALGFLMVQPNLKGILLFALTVLVILIDVYLFYFIYLFFIQFLPFIGSKGILHSLFISIIVVVFLIVFSLKKILFYFNNFSFQFHHIIKILY